MPLFLSDEEFRLCSHSVSLVATKADEAILALRRQLETCKAEADAAALTADQTYNVLEQRYTSLSAELVRVQAENAELAASLEEKRAEVGDARGSRDDLNQALVRKDGEIERLKVEVSELHKSKRQLLELLGQKDEEISEKNTTIQSYFDKIVKLTEDATEKEASLRGREAELARCRSACSRLSQEKELIEKHNKWLDEELTNRINNLAEIRKSHVDFEEDMSKKLSDIEIKFNESSKLLKQSEERVKEYSIKLTSLEEELISCKNAATTNEHHLKAELSTLTKLVELHKESSVEWSKKAGELEGVIRALETHLSQVENDYKDKLEKEISAKETIEKDSRDLKERLQKCEVELQKTKQSHEPNLLELYSVHDDANIGDTFYGGIETENENSDIIVPKMPTGISGTALAASLLRSGWSLAKIYEKYHEAADALRHEMWGRKHAEAILERVLHEIELKAEAILDERAEHETMVEAYASLNQKLETALLECHNYENAIRTLKAEMKRRDRDHSVAEKEINDLQKQVTLLLKECREVQIRYGVADRNFPEDNNTSVLDDDGSILNQMSYKDINELVRQNTELRSLVQKFSSLEQERIEEVKEHFQMELQKKTDEATAKVENVLKRCEEQACMIESLHSSVAMYKRLYEDQNKFPASGAKSDEHVSGGRKKDLLLLMENSQGVAKKANEQLAHRVRCLEDELAKSRDELLAVRLERDRTSLEAKFATEKLDSFVKDLEQQREEANGIRSRNVELSQLLVDYQRRFRESNDLLHASEELSRKLSMEVSVLKNEKEVLTNAEKRASDEIHSLSERVHRLQSSLDTIHSVGEVCEENRMLERQKMEDHIKRVDKEWAEAKKELQEERDHVRMLKNERVRALEDSRQQVERVRTELTDAWRAVSAAESRAAVSEARLSDLEVLVRSREKVLLDKDGLPVSTSSNNEAIGDMWKLREEMDKLREDAKANKNYMIQYKEIAQTNEIALKQMESTHLGYKAEASKQRNALEAEIHSLKERIAELENECILKSNEAFSAMAAKEDSSSFAAVEAANLKEEISSKMSKILEFEAQNKSLKEAFDREHERWLCAQNNYERQVILLSETIQELNKSSLAQASLQDEITRLQKYSEELKAENDMLNASWESEKSSMLKAKEAAEKMYNDINEQNKILHNHLEKLHIRLADKDVSSSAGNTSINATEDSNLQSVISYIRHAKEIADTEVALLKQEKFRMQSEREAAQKSVERLQAKLESQRENAKKVLFTDEEFKSLQLQVREINLLRESNAQLREENKHNFEECQKLGEVVQKAKVEGTQLSTEKESIIEELRQAVDVLTQEKEQSEGKISELLQKFKNVDVCEYWNLKESIQEKEVKLNDKQTEIENLKNILSKKQEQMSDLEKETLRCKNDLDDQQKKIADFLQAESTLKSDIEKQKRITANMKKRIDTLTKEKEALSTENLNLVKQLEELKLGKRVDGDATAEVAIKVKEKDTRIQMLEKTLEREREELRKEREDNKKEKTRRMKSENTIVEHLQKLHKEAKKLEVEISIHKHGVSNILESKGTTASELPSATTLMEHAGSFIVSVGKFSQTMSSAIGSTDLDSGLVTDPGSSEATGDFSAQKFSKQTGVEGEQDKSIEQKERDIPKTISDARKTVRRIVRPRLEQAEEPTPDTEMSDIEGSTVVEGKPGESHEEALGTSNLSGAQFSRKRHAPPPTSEPKEDSAVKQKPDIDTRTSKKSKGLDTMKEGAEEQAADDSSMVPSSTEEVHEDMTSQLHLSDKDVADVSKDEKPDDSVMEIPERTHDPVVGSNEDDDAKVEGETTAELEKATEVHDEIQKSDEVQEMHQSTALSEDEREEGELESGEQELQPEDGELSVLEFASGDPAVTEAAEADDGVEVAATELNEEKVNVSEEVVEVTDRSIGISQPPSDRGEGQTTSSSTQAQPSDTPVEAAATESVTHPTSTETEESQPTITSTRIVLAERARQNALLRQEGMRTRARGRRVLIRRDVGGRAARGRGGRGQPPNDQEQG